MPELNPITKLDYPDPDIIRVGDTYYMVSTTMYFMPGCEILRSFDLVNWEHAAYVYDRLDSTDAQRLEGKESIYGQGMWAASLRYHKGFFYVCFVCNDTHKTYIYRSEKIDGNWEKFNTLKGFYHDNSILFDDDGKVYIVSGNKEIHIRELKATVDESYLAAHPQKADASLSGKDERLPLILTDPDDFGFEKVIITDSDDVYLGYEGAHFYKITGKYYLFFIHMPKSTGKRTESCFVAAKPEGPYIGKDVMDDDRGYRGSGVAQGGIVDTPSGKWYSILFQDSGAVGRIPVLMTVTWKDISASLLKDGISSNDCSANTHKKSDESVSFPIFGEDNRIPKEFEIENLRAGYNYVPLVDSDDFAHAGESISVASKIYDSFGFKSCWQFNHEPDLSLVSADIAKGTVTITTDKLSSNLVQAKNTLTQRTLFPGCSCSVVLDGSNLNDGDYAGLCVLLSSYAFIGMTKRDSKYFLVMGSRNITTGGFWGERHDNEPFEEKECIEISSPLVTLYSCAFFDHERFSKEHKNAFEIAGSDLPQEDDTARFYYSEGNKENDAKVNALGVAHKLQFKLDHFTGARFGLFVYSTSKIGGSASFKSFNYFS